MSVGRLPSRSEEPRRSRRARPEPSRSPAYVPWWLLVGAVVLSALLFCGVWGIALSTRGDPMGLPTAAPVVQITAAPTPTLPPVTAPPSPTAEPTLDAPPTPLPGVIQVGGYVQVVGTGGDGLRLRVEPGVNSTVNFLGLDSEVFAVRDGPVEADGFTWWFLVNPFNDTHNGWAVQNYLEAVQGP